MPAYDGRLHASTAASIIEALTAMRARSIDADVSFVSGRVVDRARDQLADETMRGGYSHLLFIDSDVAFVGEAVEALLQRAELPIVAGAYPRRNTPGEFAIRPSPSATPKDGLIEVAGVGMGFVLIRREVIEALSREAPRYDGIARLFDGEWVDGELLSEDFAFCARARRLGFPTRVVMGLRLGHESTYLAVGSFE